MKNNRSDLELDKKLKLYMESGDEQAFSLDEGRVFQRTPTKGTPRFTRRAQVMAAAMLILVISATAIPPVRAAIGRLFTFIPGVGIVEKDNTKIYVMNPVVSRIEPDGVGSNVQFYASLENAVYTNGVLSIEVESNGGSVKSDEMQIYKNGELLEEQSGHSVWSSEIRYHNIWVKLPEVSVGDVYEVKVPGFLQQLSFTLDACSDYLDLANIGPTDIQNDLSITTTASIDQRQLTVWCYPFNTTGDRITGIGDSFPSIWEQETYIETENGFTSMYRASGQRIVERFIFTMPEGEHSATLHIPYLSMVRDEEKKATIPVPGTYEAVKSDISVPVSLGTVRITEIERKPSVYEGSADVLRISFVFESADSDKVFNSFRLLDRGGNEFSGMGRYDDETGCLQFVELGIGDMETKLSFTIYDLCYYQLGEYVIPLDIK